MPMGTVRITVHTSPTCGRTSVKGRMPRIEAQMMYLRPKRSPSGPPISVPAANENRKTKSRTCAIGTGR